MPPKRNSAPAAVADQVETAVDTAVLIPVLANDVDADGDPLKIVSFTPPAHGSVGTVANDVLNYVPAPGYVGDDAFTYTVSDPHKGVSTATVAVSVSAPNTAPRAGDDRITTVRDQPVTFEPLANDDDADGDVLRISDYTAPNRGEVVLNADRTFTYYPASGFIGDDAFRYTIADGRGGTAEGEVALTVQAPNAPPVAVSDDATIEQNTAVRLDLLANDSDPDGDSLVIVDIAVPANGSVAVHGDQTVTYTPHPDFLGTDEFAYTVSDKKVGTSSNIVTIEVVASNEAPTALALDGTTVAENAEGAVVGELTVTDPDAGDVHRFAVDDARFEVVDGALEAEGGRRRWTPRIPSRRSS